MGKKKFRLEKERESVKCYSENDDVVREESIDSSVKLSSTKKRKKMMKLELDENMNRKKWKGNYLEKVSELEEHASESHTIGEVKTKFETGEGRGCRTPLKSQSTKNEKKKKKHKKEKEADSEENMVLEEGVRRKKKPKTESEDNLVITKTKKIGRKKAINEIECHKEKQKTKKQKCDSAVTESRIEDEDGNNSLEAHSIDSGLREQYKKKKKKSKGMESVVEKPTQKEKQRTKKNLEATNPLKPRKVSFSDHVEVFPLPDDIETEVTGVENTLVQGKRFSAEEDEIVKKAVFGYIKAHGLGEEGLKMVLRCKEYPELKNVWREIGAAIPYRPYRSVYQRAHVLFESVVKDWTPEQMELLKSFIKNNGTKNWRVLGNELGKHWKHVRNQWKRIRLPNMKKGKWSQDEYQTLFDLVNEDLSRKAFKEKETMHGMWRDNIGWTAISEQLSTRNDTICCLKWYGQLTSHLVSKGEWNSSDDYYLVDSLVKLDACCIDDVEWDSLLEHRSGAVCRERWNQMVRHISEYTRSFTEEVDVLSKRYLPELIEARVAYESKQAVS